MVQLILLAAAFLAAALVSFIACHGVRRLGIVDAPDGERKFQAAPVPRLGGLGIAIGFTLAALATSFFAPLWPEGSGLCAALLIAGAFTLIGLADDVTNLFARPKLTLLLAACIGAPLLGLSPSALDTPFGPVSATWLLFTGTALWLLVFSNAANFMDGSNGLSMGSLAIMFAGLGASVASTGDSGFPPILIVTTGAIFGFLIHNMSGKLYAGDVGALGVGGLFGVFALVADLPVWTIATLALPFLADTLLTLILRVRRGESLLRAHRDHAYQALMKAGWGHWEVAILWWGLAAACAAAASVGAAGGGALPFIVFWCLALLLSAGWVAIQRQAGHVIARL